MLRIEWKSCFRICASLFVLWLCIGYWPQAAAIAAKVLQAAMPLIFGAVTAYLVNILMSLYEKYYFQSSTSKFANGSRRPVCMLAAFVTLAAIVVFIFRMIVPQLTACVSLIFAELPGFFVDVVKWIDEMNILPENITDTLNGVDWRSKFTQIIKVLTDGVGNVMNLLIATVSSVFSWLVTALLSFIFAIYLLLGKETLCAQFKKTAHRYMNNTVFSKVQYVVGVADDCFRSYIVGQCLEAVIIGCLCTAGMMVLKFPYASMIGALVAFTALIPVAGAYIGAIVGAFMILTVSPVKALGFLVFIVILQQLEGNIIYPKVVGSSMGLPGIWVLAAVTVGGGVMGILGMLLGVPLAAVLYRLLREDVDRGLALRENIPELIPDEE